MRHGWIAASSGNAIARLSDGGGVCVCVCGVRLGTRDDCQVALSAICVGEAVASDWTGMVLGEVFEVGGRDCGRQGEDMSSPVEDSMVAAVLHTVVGLGECHKVETIGDRSMLCMRVVGLE